jgi:hypothetical protein
VGGWEWDEEEVGYGRRETVGCESGKKRRWDGMGKKKVECKSARGRKVDFGSGMRRMTRVGARDGGEEGGISPFHIQAVFSTALLWRFLARVWVNQSFSKFQDWFMYVLLIWFKKLEVEL